MNEGRNRAGTWAVAIALILALGIGILTGSIVTAKSSRAVDVTAVPVRVSATSPVQTGEVSFSSGFSAVVANVIPSVVNIASSKIVSNRGQSNPFMDPLFRNFFGDQFRAPRERRERSLGSGVIISPDGYILTNSHVVGGASEITVSMANNQDYKARLIGTDPKTDIAVVKLDARNLPVAVLGNSSVVRVGEFVLAIGSPFGLSQTVTMGIVSAKGRVNLNIEEYEDFIQTDAAINPGNSGGALVNVRGELIGINTAIVSGGSGNQGVGFAIPINMAREVMAQIIKTGKVVRGYLGAWIQPVTPEIAKAFNIPKANGALVGDVESGSPAAKGGLQRGDIIAAVNGEPVSDSSSFRMKIAMTAPGTRVRLRVLHNGSERNVDVTLGELQPKEDDQNETRGGGSGQPQSLQGISVDNLTPGLANQLKIPAGTKGVVVTNVEQGSAAEEAGVQRGDVILEVNRKPVSNVGDFRRAASSAGPVLLLIDREGSTLYVVVNS